MNKVSYKNKIFILLGIWFLVSLVMFFKFFTILDTSNTQALSAIADQNKDLALLIAEQESYIKAKADLQKISKEDLQPEDFFSKDIALVNEIKTLESWAQRLNLKMQLGGVSGTINNIPKAKTLTSIGTVPYSVNIVGGFTQAVNFVEVLENLSFITNINSLSISSGEGGQVTLNISANFYLKK